MTSNTRFRLKGDTWQVVPSLIVLLAQVDEAWPAPHAADGTLASVRHREVSPLSDHNPDINGDVRAADIGEVTEDDAFVLAEAIRVSKDPRVKYVIHEKRMFSYYEKHDVPSFTWRPYSGANGHWSHVHISVLAANQNDVSLWNIGIEKGDEKELKELIKAIQTALNAGGFKGANNKVLSVDGVIGPNTQFALNSQAHAAAQQGTSTTAKTALAEASSAHTRLNRLHTV